MTPKARVVTNEVHNSPHTNRHSVIAEPSASSADRSNLALISSSYLLRAWVSFQKTPKKEFEKCRIAVDAHRM